MRYERDGFSVEAALAKGRALPQWYLDEPEVTSDDNFFIAAFSELSTCRHQRDIPWNCIIEYASYHELDREMTRAFVYVIRMMDRALLKWQDDEREQKRRANQRQTSRARH